jgi:hypothetical protein
MPAKFLPGKGLGTLEVNADSSDMYSYSLVVD